MTAPCAVSELAKGLPVSRPAVSQHLKVLKQAGLVVDQAVGARRVYRAVPQALVDMQAYFQAFWDQALAGFQDQAERRRADADG